MYFHRAFPLESTILGYHHWWENAGVFNACSLSPPHRTVESGDDPLLVGGLMWFGNVWNMFYFCISGEESSQLTFIFFRGVAEPETS